MADVRARAGGTVSRVVGSVRGWAPSRPRLIGAVLGLAATLVIVGCGLANVVVDVGPVWLRLAAVVVSVAVMFGLLTLVAPLGRRMPIVLLSLVALALVAPVGFHHAVLSWRGEQTVATVTEVSSFRTPPSVEQYSCTLVLADGHEATMTGDVCTASTRIDDNVRVFADPRGLVPPRQDAPAVPIPVFGTVVGAAALLVVLMTSQAMGHVAKRRRTL